MKYIDKYFDWATAHDNEIVAVLCTMAPFALAILAVVFLAGV